ncbi:hypothetical protein JW926_02205 [Candidatus Sumerlaeota bacterium]|nr:hypothetical protein [Candidatus Sumerlaeota bacterium]
MKKIFILMIVLMSAVYAGATTFPVIEPFHDETIDLTWEQFWTNSATLESVQASGESCGDSSLGDEYIGKTTCTTTGTGSSGHVTGEDTDSNYTIQAYVYTPVVNTDAAPQDYWYQQLVFYRIGATGGVPTSYGRLHTHFNTFGGDIPAPRIRIMVGTYSLIWSAPDFTVPVSSSWHKMKIELNGTTANCYFDDLLLPGTVDWTSASPGVTAGRFGFGQYMNGAGTLSMYVDMFKAYQGAEPPDPPVPTPTDTPVPTPTLLAAQNWMYFE